MAGLTGLVLATSVPVATVQDRHKFEECSGAETNLVYNAFLLGRDSIDVTVNHQAFPEPVAVNLQKSGNHYDLPASENLWVVKLGRDKVMQEKWGEAYGQWRADFLNLTDLQAQADRAIGCYDAVRNRINDIAENPEKYWR